MPFTLLAPPATSGIAEHGLPTLNEALSSVENMLRFGKPIGVVYLDIAKYGHLEGSFGQETFDEIITATAEALRSYSGKLFRKDDQLLISEDLGDVFIIIFSTTRSQSEMTEEVLQGVVENLQKSLNEELKKRFHDLIRQKIGYFAGYSILYPDERVNARRQIHRAIKEALRMSLGREMDELEKKISHLRGIIRCASLTSYFQPIVSFEPFEILGHELLTRGPGGSRLVDAEMMFQIAQRGGLALDLERAARNKLVETLSGRELEGKLFLNNGPKVIMSPEFSDLLAYDRLGWEPQKIVIEITEGEAISNLREMKNRLGIFRREGCQIAVDDIGKGNSGLYLLTELEPDYAKIDRALVSGIDRDELKQRLMSKLIEFADQSDTQFIAEGIETVEEFKTLKRLGVKLGQGYFFGIPGPNPVTSEEWWSTKKVS